MKTIDLKQIRKRFQQHKTRTVEDTQITFESLVSSAPQIIKDKLNDLKSLRERPDFHPESSAFEHIKIVTERLIQTQNTELILAGLLHDICKFDTAVFNKKTGFMSSPGHDKSAFDLIMGDSEIKQFIISFGGDIHTVANICKFHMRFHLLSQMRQAKREKEIQSFIDLGIFDLLTVFSKADDMLSTFTVSDSFIIKD